MNTKIIRKTDTDRLLGQWLKEYNLFAPVQRDNLVVFDRVSSASEILLDYPNTIKSAKSLLLPQYETLFTYDLTDSAQSIEAQMSNEAPQLLFGVRPCDARSFLLLDKVFDGERYKDVYYLNRRANTFIVAIGCTEPRTTCFCTSVGGGPFAEEGSDLLLIDIGDAYVIKVTSERGAELLKDTELEDAGEDELALVEKTVRDAEANITTELAIDGLQEELDSRFEDPLWGPLTEKCLGCGICTYLCPTCYCFDIVDEVSDSKGERIRLWDSCQFPQFTLQASRFNPRSSNKERLRQRIMHKFSYIPANFSQTGCVGCGRCIAECPVNVDIRNILDEILKEKVAK